MYKNDNSFQPEFNSNLPIIRKADFNGKQKYSINSWELFEKLERTNYANWCRDEIIDKGIENTDFILRSATSLNQKGRPRREFLLSIEFTKHLVLQSNAVFGKEYRKYLINFEEQNKDKVQLIAQSPEAAKFYVSFLESFKQISNTAYLTMGAKISKEVFGIEVPQFMLPVVDEPRWSATEIGIELNKSPQAIGKITNTLNLKNPPLGLARLSIAKHTNKEVSMYYYNAEAKQLIKEYLNQK